MDIKEEDIKFEFRMLNPNNNVVANMTLILGPFEFYNYKVMKTKYQENGTKFFIKPVSIKINGGSWFNLSRCKKEFWEKIEKKAIRQFNRDFGQILDSNKNKEDGVSIDEIFNEIT